MARHSVASAAAAGADGVLLLPPYLVSSTPEGLVRHIRYVLAGASSPPVIVYQRGAAVLSPSAATELLSLPPVAGLKDGVGDIEAMHRLVTTVRRSGHPRAGTFAFLNGLPTAELSAAAYRAIGVPAYSSAVHCFVPDLAHAFHDALERGDEPAVLRLLDDFYLPLAALRDQVPGYAVSLVKAGVRLAGLPVGGVRPPLVDPVPEHVDRLAEIVAAGRAAVSRLAPRGRRDPVPGLAGDSVADSTRDSTRAADESSEEPR
jgi:5-dehydro-4-deoxyglucarate dehydratase